MIELREREPEFNVFDIHVSMSLRLRRASMWYFSKGFTPEWTYERERELFDLHDSHYHQTSEYKSMERFFDRIAPALEGVKCVSVSK